jgi:hypothetical protein
MFLKRTMVVAAITALILTGVSAKTLLPVNGAVRAEFTCQWTDVSVDEGYGVSAIAKREICK